MYVAWVVFSAVVAAVLGATTYNGDPKAAQILRYDSDSNPDGSYQWAFRFCLRINHLRWVLWGAEPVKILHVTIENAKTAGLAICLKEWLLQSLDSYETENGISASADGVPKQVQLVEAGAQGPQVAVASKGAFGWTSPEGEPISIQYIADENGYQPQGNILPTPPPIPPAIQRALDFIQANPSLQNQEGTKRY
ncbi:hypothetical protein NQ317_012777 [Molorchus minor]|uniref:Uncharacterized protein n=1 Tax=Molorchus minor TaxID=1323400 RepID=A0ABQ9K3D9_9CUCU|nr:hypothetical protein NQ317_012777 [Molorchus minor]